MRRWGGPGITTLVGVGFAVIPSIQSYTLALGVWAVAAVWAVYLAWPKLGGWWPFALARTGDRLRTKLREAEQDIERLRLENEQLKEENGKLTRTQNDRRRDLIKSWRDGLDSHDPVEGNILRTATYSAIRPHLKPEIRDDLENPRLVNVEIDSRSGEDRLVVVNQDPFSVKNTLLDEVARIEGEWQLI